jgi:hypothetical protein
MSKQEPLNDSFIPEDVTRSPRTSLIFRGCKCRVTIQAIAAATFRVGKKTLGGTALTKTVFGGEAHKLRQSKSARANFGRRFRSRSLVDCAKPQPCSFGRHPPLHLDCQECGQRGSGVAGGIARSDPRKSWDRTQCTVSLHCASWMTSLSAAGCFPMLPLVGIDTSRRFLFRCSEFW